MALFRQNLHPHLAVVVAPLLLRQRIRALLEQAGTSHAGEPTRETPR